MNICQVNFFSFLLLFILIFTSCQNTSGETIGNASREVLAQNSKTIEEEAIMIDGLCLTDFARFSFVDNTTVDEIIKTLNTQYTQVDDFSITYTLYDGTEITFLYNQEKYIEDVCLMDSIGRKYIASDLNNSISTLSNEEVDGIKDGSIKTDGLDFGISMLNPPHPEQLKLNLSDLEQIPVGSKYYQNHSIGDFVKILGFPQGSYGSGIVYDYYQFVDNSCVYFGYEGDIYNIANDDKDEKPYIRSIVIVDVLGRKYQHSEE